MYKRQILGVRPEYLLCEDNCKSPEELEEFHKRKEMSHLLDMKITSDIAILTSTIVKNIETNNENSFISNSDYNEFRKDISAVSYTHLSTRRQQPVRFGVSSISSIAAREV